MLGMMEILHYLSKRLEKTIKVIIIQKKVMQTKTLKSEGRIISYFDNPDRRVFHNWDEAAIKYTDKSKKDEYYLFGQKMTKEEWLETKRDFNGIPPSKNPAYEQSMLH